MQNQTFASVPAPNQNAESQVSELIEATPQILTIGVMLGCGLWLTNAIMQLLFKR